MLSGELYDPTDKELEQLRLNARKLVRKYNLTDEDQPEEQAKILRKLLPTTEELPYLQAPVYFDYGCNTFFGKFSSANFNFTCLDVCEIHIGDHVMIGPNVTLATPMHPLLPEERNIRKREDGSFYNLEYAKPITIKDNCWLASNVVVCGGVTIGEGCVIGAGSVVMPYGGKNQLTEVQTMVAKVPVAKGNTDAVTMMSYGFNPYLSSWSPYHGAVYAVTESIAKITAAGGDYSKIRMTFQEYFRRMTEDSHTWGLPFASLLGAYAAQMGFGLPSIGGKDSMSGSFDELNVPPTLVSFAVDVASENDVVTPEFKKAGNKLVLFAIEKDEYDLPNYEQVKKLYGQIHEAVRNGQIVSSYAIGAGGIAEAVSKMAFGNGLGAVINAQLDKNLLFAPLYGNILAEVPAECIADLVSR